MYLLYFSYIISIIYTQVKGHMIMVWGYTTTTFDPLRYCREIGLVAERYA